MFILYPLIIFDGHLYEREYIENEPELTLSNYTQYLAPFGSPSPEQFVVDIVKIDFLSEYLGMLGEEIEKLAEKIGKLKLLKGNL